MKVLVFRVVCRPHNLFEEIKIPGADTLRNRDRGYDRAYETMTRGGCDTDCADANVTYTLVRDDSIRPTLKQHQSNEGIS